MSRSFLDVLKVIEDNKIEVIELKMSDISGRVHTATIPARLFTEEFVQNGIPVDTARCICVEYGKGDSMFVPDLDSATVDLFAIVPSMTISGQLRAIYVNNGVYMAEPPTPPQKGTRGDKVAGLIFSIVSLYFGIEALVWACLAAFFAIAFGWVYGMGLIYGVVYGFVSLFCLVIAIVFGILGKKRGIRCGRTTRMASIGLVFGIVSAAIMLLPLLLLTLFAILFLVFLIIYFVFVMIIACFYGI